MQRRVNPYEPILIGENSFIRLSVDGGQTTSARCSHWRVLWTPAGPGHALFLDEGPSTTPQIYSDSEPLVRFLQSQIEHLLHKPFGDVNLPIKIAEFERRGAPPNVYQEVIRVNGGVISLTWSDFLTPFNFSTDPGCDGRPIGLQTTFFPAISATWSNRGTNPIGSVWKTNREGQPSTSACLAWAESWVRPVKNNPLHQ